MRTTAAICQSKIYRLSFKVEQQCMAVPWRVAFSLNTQRENSAWLMCAVNCCCGHLCLGWSVELFTRTVVYA